VAGVCYPAFRLTHPSTPLKRGIALAAAFFQLPSQGGNRTGLALKVFFNPLNISVWAGAFAGNAVENKNVNMLKNSLLTNHRGSKLNIVFIISFNADGIFVKTKGHSPMECH